jgi:hypothetical protein
MIKVEFKLIIDQFEKIGIKVPTPKQMDSWSLKSENLIKDWVVMSLRDSSIDPSKGIDFENFKKWLYKDNRNIQVGYINKIINVATSLTCLDDYGFVEGSRPKA